MNDKRVLEMIDAWHEGRMSMPLHSYLGWTWEQYILWLESGIMPDS